jgi:hypothetical protein
MSKEQFNQHHKGFRTETTHVVIKRFIDGSWEIQTFRIKEWNPDEEAYEVYVARQQNDERAAREAAQDYIDTVELAERYENT